VPSFAVTGVASVVAALVVSLLPGLTAPAEAARSARPARPGPLTVATVTQSGAVVDFGRSKGSGRVSYRIKAGGKTVARSRRTSRVPVSLACGRTYVLSAVAVDRRGRRSTPSPSARLRTRACLDKTPPTAPTGLVATSRTGSEVGLAWKPARDKVGVTGYLVYRDGVVLGGATGRAYVARNLRASTTYTFSVRARDRAGNLSAPVTLRVATTLPPQSTGDNRSFVLTTDDASFADAQRHYRQLDRVFPTFFELTRHGDVSGTGRPALTTWFQDRGVRVMPRFHSEDPGVIEALLTDPVRRNRGAEQVAAIVREGGYDGASLDLEMSMPTVGTGTLTKQERWDAIRDGYSAYVERISELVHADGGLVSVAVSANWCTATDPLTRATVYCSDSGSRSTVRPRAYLFDYPRLLAAADELWVMAWGLHWSTSESGPVADLRWLSAVVDYYHDLLADRPELVEKLTLGTNLYAMDWSETVVRTDRIAWPGSAYPTAPVCPVPSRTARARTSYEGVPGSGTLVVDWVCLNRAATTREHQQVVSAFGEFTSNVFDEESAENVLTVDDPVAPGAQRVLWYVDRRTIQQRAALAASAGWSLGFWRLGREDQSIWSLAELQGSAS